MALSFFIIFILGIILFGKVFSNTEETNKKIYAKKNEGVKFQRVTSESKRIFDASKPGGKMKIRKEAIMLEPCDCQFDAVGESYYRDNLMKVEAKYGTNIIATLVPENDNPHDKNAVAVVVHGIKIAHLSRGDAETFRETHAQAISEGKPIDCYAELSGDADSEYGFGVFLDFDIDEEVRYGG